VDLVIREGGLTVRPVIRRYALADLLAKVTEKNIHGEVAMGGPVGREVW